MNKKFINFEDEDIVSKYFKDIRKKEVISQESEIELAKKIKKGDKKAIKQLVEANLKFVVSIAKEYQNQGLTLPDLINEGNYGLIKAATRFDHKRGFRFISYAVWWIRQSIIQSLNENGRVVRLPVNIIGKISKLNKELNKTDKNNISEKYFDSNDKDVNKLQLLSNNRCSSLNDVITEDGDEIIDLLISDEPEENIVTDRVKEELNKTLSILSERELNIVKSYFGIDTNCEPMTLEAIGEKYGLTKERIRQIKLKALRKLRHNSSALYDVINE